MKGVVYLFFLFAYLFGITIQKEKKCFSYKNKDLCIEYNDIDDNCIVSYDYQIRNTITFSKLINIDKIDYKIHDDNILLVFFDSTNIYFNELTLANANIVNLYSQLTINQCTKQNNFDYSFNANNIISKYHCINSDTNILEQSFYLSNNRILQTCTDATKSVQAGQSFSFTFNELTKASLNTIQSISCNSGTLKWRSDEVDSSTIVSPYTTLTYTAPSSGTSATITFTEGASSCTINISIYSCYSSCLTCSGLGTSSNQLCVDCQTGYYLSGTNCLSCDTECLSCSGSSSNCQSCSGSYLLDGSSCVSSCTSPKFAYGGECITTCPSPLYKQDLSCVSSCSSNYYLYSTNKECYQTCPSGTFKEDSYCVTTCKTGYFGYDGECINKCPGSLLKENDSCVSSCQETGNFGYNGECISQCPSGMYKQDNTCVSKCKDQLSPNDLTRECDNCKKTGDYKKPNEDACISDRKGYYVIESEYNYLAKCDSNCTECDHGKINNTNFGCTACANENLYKEMCYPDCEGEAVFMEGTCDKECLNGLVPYTKINGKTGCRNCKALLQSSYMGKCVSNQSLPSNVYLNNSDTNYYMNCYYTCDGCYGYGDEEDSNCKSCKNGMYHDYKNSNNCVESCKTYLYAIESTKECGNCKDDSNKVKLKGEIDCIDSSQLPTNTFKNMDFEEYNYYEYCSDMCATCTKTSDFDSNNCLTCAKYYYPIENKPHDCSDQCPNYEVNNHTLEKCVNCKSITDADGNPLVRYENIEECIAKPKNTYITNTDYNVIKDCYEKCETCEEGGDITNHNCISCIAPFYLSSEDNQNCVLSCDVREVIDEQNRKCINCKKIGKVKYDYSDVCLDPIEGTYEVDSYYGIIRDCYSKCKTCSANSIDPDNQLCTECKGNIELQNGNCYSRCKEGYYLYNKVCYSECPDYTVINEEERQCERCPEFYLAGQCVGFKPDNTYEIVGASSTVTVLEYCYPTCAKCDEGGDEEDNKCTQCKVGNFKIENTNNCVESCPSYLATDATNYICYNCRIDDNGKFKFPGAKACINTIPDGAVLTNPSYNLVENCYNTCKKCSKGGNSVTHNCDECKDTYYKSGDVKGNCVRYCAKEFYQSTNPYECVNCAENGGFKYIDVNECLPTQPAHSVVIDSTYGIIVKCFERCEECSGPDDTELIQNCISCIAPYYLKYKSTNCIDECGELYYQDEENKKCINCKDENKYKYRSHNECIDKPPNAIIINEDNNIIEDCYESCGSCDILGDSINHNCITCKTGYSPNYYNASQCEKDCDKRWYFDDHNKYFCTSDLNCIPDRKNLVEETSQCVESCYPESSCILCESKTLYLDTENNKCVEECPANTFKNLKNHECSFIGNDINCKAYTVYTNKTLSTEITKTFALYYISTFLDYSNKYVDIIKGPEYTLEIFTLSSCQYDISYKETLTYIDIENCENKIKEKYSKYAIVKIDMRKVENNDIPNQIEYVAYDENGNEIDLSICDITESIGTTYPINKENKKEIDSAKEFADKGIDVYNIKDPFFNDVCYAYYTKENKDVILKDRREFIYKNIKLCENNCVYSKIDYDNDRVNCNCSFKSNYSLEYIDNEGTADDTKIQNSNASNNNFLFFKCISSIFSNFGNNYGSLTIMVIFFIQILFTVIYLISSNTKLHSTLYRNDTHYKSNPPRRSKMKNSDSSTELKETMRTQQKKRGNYIDVRVTTKEETSPKNDISPQISMENEKEGKDVLLKEDISTKPIIFSLLKTRLSTSTDQLYKEIYAKQRKKLDDDILDVLPYNESIRHDTRKLCEIVCQYVKEKIIILSSLLLISSYEHWAYQLITMLFNISIVIFVSAMMFFQNYVSTRYKKKGDHGLVYLLSNELNNCFIIGVICAVLIHIETLFLSGRKKLKCMKYQERESEKNEFYFKMQEELKKYTRNKTIILIVFLCLMILIWLYVSSFCVVYQKMYLTLMEATFISIIACMMIQMLMCFIIGCFRYIAKTCYNKCMYKLSQILI